ncbi:thermonuclease family protein [Pontixanthobacter luteolus]|uniref:thermonuclease family protein n=1 Tax=Pontixanthobacter luteolus TaxID=295089 RepID=UPI00230410EE|nr:thermonuclease family protein [Pontixanthobacter luteolus]
MAMLRILFFALLMAAPAAANCQIKGGDAVEATFEKCGSAKRVTCIVDGDTFWHDGTKVRIADVNTPETSLPSCPRERELGNRATARMQTLLNEGPFQLVRAGRDEDRYGRKLRVAMRGGKSLGGILVNEGLAESWTGRRKNWF